MMASIAGQFLAEDFAVGRGQVAGLFLLSGVVVQRPQQT